MNLEDQPTLEQLQAIIAAADDVAGHHVLWVDTRGSVHLSLLPEGLGPIGFEESNKSMCLRYETCDPGNGYVGIEAANDLELMERLYSSLLREWPNRLSGGRVEYVDSW